MKIIVAIDSYKNCISSIQAAQAVEQGLNILYDQPQIVSIPLSDGGEGFLDACAYTQPLLRISAPAHDALMHPISAEWAVSIDGTTAFIESAQTIGLYRLHDSQLDPLNATSYGLGEQIQQAINHGCKKIVIGLGGTATNDAGVGAMQVLGLKCDFDNYDMESPCNNPIVQLKSIDSSPLTAALKDIKILALTDVTNPLLGRNGATYTFCEQKGGTHISRTLLELAMQRYVEIVHKDADMNSFAPGIFYFYIEHQDPSMGAAGGIPYSLASFTKTKIMSGGQWLLDKCDFQSLIADADFIITGEGRTDAQTLNGKLPYLVLQYARQAGVPCILLSGQIDSSFDAQSVGYAYAQSITPRDLPLSAALSQQIATSNLTNAVVNCPLFEEW